MTKSNRAVAKAINPATGEPDLKGALRYVITKLNEEKDIKRGGLYHVLNGAMRQRLECLKIPAAYIADFALMMQEVGLSRHYGGGTNTIWEVIDIRLFDEVVIDEWLEKAYSNLCQRHATMTSCRKLREKMDGLEKSGPPANSDILPEHIEQMAEMVAEVERLGNLIEQKKDRIVELEKELANRPKNDASAVAAELVNRFRRSKTS